MEQSFAGAGIAHVQRITRLNHGVRGKVVFNQNTDGLGANVGRDVTRLEIAQQRMDQHAVHGFDRHFGQIFVGTVHGVARLESSHLGPAHFLEFGTGLCRGHELLAIFFHKTARGQHFDRTRQVVFTLSHDHLDTRMFHVGRLINLHALVCLVDGVFFRDLQGRQDFARFTIGQRDFGTGLDGLVIRGQRDRNRPEKAIGHFHAIANALPVGMGHEAIQRGKTTDTQHDNVTRFAGAHLDLRQRLGAGHFAGQCRTFKQQRLQCTAAMGIYECHS